MQSLPKVLIVLFVVACLATSAGAQGVQIADYLGYAWETGGFLPSEVGDVFQFVAVTTDADPLLGVDLGVEEVTFYVYGLTSLGETVEVDGSITVQYSGGTMEMWRDVAMDADFGTFVPSATVPSTFNNGQELLLNGSFSSFALNYSPTTEGGVYAGVIDAVGGTLVTDCTGCVFTWGGTFNSVPEAPPGTMGYDMQMDGVLEVDPAVPTREQAWGALKAQYGN
jgi:hypothetical protein